MFDCVNVCLQSVGQFVAWPVCFLVGQSVNWSIGMTVYKFVGGRLVDQSVAELVG